MRWDVPTMCVAGYVHTLQEDSEAASRLVHQRQSLLSVAPPLAMAVDTLVPRCQLLPAKIRVRASVHRPDAIRTRLERTMTQAA